MKRNFTFLFIVTILLNLLPVQLHAITQTQLSSQVQIICPDNQGNLYSGSGTIIDSKGVILTNRHVVTDQSGNLIQTCTVGFIKSSSEEPNFHTNGEINLAEVKHFSKTKDLDVALLVIARGPGNYSSIDISSGNTTNLELGDIVEVIGYPAIGGTTVTYTNGVFSGFGSSGNNTHNYFKTTAPLEHGNSGGAAYDSSGNFLGIPTMVVSGTLNSLSYILKVDSIKSWLSNVLGVNYNEEISTQKADKVTEIKPLPSDTTAPNLSDISRLCYNVFDDNIVASRCFPEKLGKAEEFNKIQFVVVASELRKIEDDFIENIYYYFDTKAHSFIDSNAKKYNLEPYKNNKGNLEEVSISDVIEIDEPGAYYFTFFAEDDSGNISNPYIYEYVYEPDIFKQVSKLVFYEDASLSKPLLGYNVDFSAEPNNYEHRPIECKTKLNNLTLYWEYPNAYNNYVVETSNAWGSLITKTSDGNIVSNTDYTMKNLRYGNVVPYNGHYYETEGYLREKAKYYAFYLKPLFDGASSELNSQHQMVSLIYDTSINQNIECRDGKIFQPTNNLPNFALADELKGKILLQVEENGEAWYIDPESKKRFYLKNGEVAYNALRKFGLGITNENLSKIPVGVEDRFEDVDSDGDGLADQLEEGLKTDPFNYDTDGDGVSDGVEVLNNNTNPLGSGRLVYSSSLVNDLSGRILLQVESHGEAWYINPKDGKRYYMKNGDAAYQIMRFLSLGITNSNLSGIPIGNL